MKYRDDQELVNVASAVMPWRQQVQKLEQRLARANELLRQIRAWDQLPMTGDGPFWMARIDAHLKDCA